MKNLFTRMRKLFLAMFAMVTVLSCTDLTIEGTDSLLQETPEFEGVEDVAGSLTSVYQATYGMLGDQANFFALNEVTTDETLVPTRGTDWSDNGIWRQLHNHTWKQDHGFILTTWNQLNGNAYRATEIIDPLSQASAQQAAEAKFLRAFNMYFVLDFWGVAPFRNATDPGSSIPTVLSSQEAYDFIVQDLNEAISDLPAVGPSAATSRASKSAARYLLAKVMLNSERYTGAAPNYGQIISLIDGITGEGYALAADYFNIFNPAVDTETIWYANESLGIGNRIWNGLHYNMTTPDNGGGGWNGFSTLAEFYDLFEGDANQTYMGSNQEERRGWVPDATTADNTSNLGIGYGFLQGQQYSGSGAALTDRSGNPLSFTKDLSLTNSNETNGIRIIKYHPNPMPPGVAGGSQSFRAHEIIFRYADAFLMKAEATLRNGGDATAMVNQLRALRGASALANVSLQDMIDERGRELYYEFWRRNDLLRFGQFTKDWEYKDPSAIGDANRRLFPIPLAALVSNPNLAQNPGY